ncbi:MAG TPA: hypothetical protein VIJ31_18085, partial [Acidothermaceae bacterium]
ETRQVCHEAAGFEMEDGGDDAPPGSEVRDSRRGFEIGELRAIVVPGAGGLPAFLAAYPDVSDRPPGGAAHQLDCFVEAE